MTHFLFYLVVVLGTFSPLLALGWTLERLARTGCRCHSPRRFPRALCAFLLEHGHAPQR